jgi:hypothetical protein
MESLRIKKVEVPWPRRGPDTPSGHLSGQRALQDPHLPRRGELEGGDNGGPRNPVELTSRADSAESKQCSLCSRGEVGSYTGRI